MITLNLPLLLYTCTVRVFVCLSVSGCLCFLFVFGLNYFWLFIENRLFSYSILIIVFPSFILQSTLPSSPPDALPFLSLIRKEQAFRRYQQNTIQWKSLKNRHRIRDQLLHRHKAVWCEEQACGPCACCSILCDHEPCSVIQSALLSWCLPYLPSPLSSFYPSSVEFSESGFKVSLCKACLWSLFICPICRRREPLWCIRRCVEQSTISSHFTASFSLEQ